MTSRASILACLVLAVACSTVAACSLPRGSIVPTEGMDGGGRVDADVDGTAPDDVGVRDDATTDDAAPPDAGTDAGPPCSPGGCDDGNPCTADRCDATGCRHDAASSSCDDGILCNGADSCSGGACSVHDGGNPCPGASVCDSASDTCMGCAGPLDCPAEMRSDWGACEFPANVCEPLGVHRAELTTYACVAGTCVASTGPTSEPCSRSTDGVDCGSSVGSWSTCDGFTDDCDEMGERTRTVTMSMCSAGSCSTALSLETEPCARSTAGLACGDPTTPICTIFGPCMPTAAATCSPAGTRTRTCAMPVCAAGTCSGMGAGVPETEACPVTVTGTPCTTTMMCMRCIESGRTDCRHGRVGTRMCSGPAGMCSGPGTCVGAVTNPACNCP